ncbi:MAG: acyl-ACP desaturase, partial [Acidimicrobiales bacterium]
DAGIYDFAIHHDKILKPVVLRDWAIESIEGLSAQAEEAREALVAQISRIGTLGHRLAERREKRLAMQAEREPVRA